MSQKSKTASGSKGALVSLSGDYPLHKLGWKAFQDLAVGIAEECLRRPVQNFLPNHDAGRDGAFVGRWDGDDPAAGESTIQCKFTSSPSKNLTLSLLKDEMAKAKLLASLNLADDYIILTNHPVTGASDLTIRAAFEQAGVGRCRIFGYDWITRQIRTSPQLRMMAPRLYGLGDLNDVLDGRAYEQAQLILSAMGEDLQRLVVTEAHRGSVRAISKHNLVLLLGAPAAGKSTIGASIAVGAADIWKSATIRITSPEDLRRHLSANGSQFFWIDDAWGNTQYQRQTAEAWNQVFPLMQGAMMKGSRFLITSRDYIWQAAQSDLKLQAIPVLKQSQVVINVEELSTSEKAQILYNHVKLGDQSASFKAKVKDFLPALAQQKGFLPETARRLGSRFFAADLELTDKDLNDFFRRPQQFLFDTITNLSDACRAAIAVIFLNGGKVRSPVSHDEMASAASAFGVSAASVRSELQALNGSLLLLAQDDEGPYWTYKHPTVSDAFAKYLAGTPELVEIYLRGARPESIVYEVICAGAHLEGATLTVPNSLLDLLFERLVGLDTYLLKTFVSYRSNALFTSKIVEAKPDILTGLTSYFVPIQEDPDARLLISLHRQGLLSADLRDRFVKAVLEALVEKADPTVFEMAYIDHVLTQSEMSKAVELARMETLEHIPHYVTLLREQWNGDTSPEDHFYGLEQAISAISQGVAKATGEPADDDALGGLQIEVRLAVWQMESEYEPPSSTAAPVASSTPQNADLHTLFRDVDE
ncbi:nSTAND3 domain-containing NTPase [Sphingopyxis chilensis]